MKILGIVLVCACMVISGTRESGTWNTKWETERIVLRESSSTGTAHQAAEGISVFRVLGDNIYWGIPRGDQPVNKDKEKGKNPLITLGITSTANRSIIEYSPYPTWEYQKLGNCSALQSVTDLEIDPEKRLWVLDSGSKICPPKLVIFEFNGTKLLEYEFQSPKTHQKQGLSWNYDNILLDHEKCGFAYIHRNVIQDDEYPQHGIVVFSLMKNAHWNYTEESLQISRQCVRAKRVLILSPLDATLRFVYYSGGTAVFGIEVEKLRKNDTVVGIPKEKENHDCSVRAMVSSAAGNTYAVTADLNANITVWNQTTSTSKETKLKNTELISIDGNGKIWGFSYNAPYEKRVLYEFKIGSPNYQYHENGFAPAFLSIPYNSSVQCPPISNTTQNSSHPFIPSKPDGFINSTKQKVQQNIRFMEKAIYYSYVWLKLNVYRMVHHLLGESD